MHKYMFHCKHCGYHHECADKAEATAIKRSHKQKGCEMGFIPLVNGTKIWVRDDIAADYRKWVDEQKRLQQQDDRERKLRAERAALLARKTLMETEPANVIELDTSHS